MNDSWKVQSTAMDGSVTFMDFVKLFHNDWNQHIQHVTSDKECKINQRVLLPTLNFTSVMDIRVFAKGRPDDLIYAKNQYARENIPRGNFIAEIKGQYYYPLLRAFPKFTGMEDDGECNLISNNISDFFIQSKKKAKYVLVTKKENGEAAHLSILKLKNGKYLYVIGSKNVHLIVSNKSEIKETTKYVGHDPYVAARPIALALFDMMDAMEKSTRILFCELLSSTRATASFEILCPSHQHVESLDHYQKNTPIFYGLTLPSLRHQSVKGTELCLNPILYMEWLKKNSCCCVVPYTIVEIDVFYEQVHSFYYVENKDRIEGYVILYLNDEWDVIGMEKMKTLWYISLRAIREKGKWLIKKLMKEKNNTKNKQDDVIQTKIALSKRFIAIQNFVGVKSTCMERYKSLGDAFLDYLHTAALVEKSDVKTEMIDMFPKVWAAFLVETQHN